METSQQLLNKLTDELNTLQKLSHKITKVNSIACENWQKTHKLENKQKLNRNQTETEDFFVRLKV